MATRDQLEELDREMFLECKKVLGLHGYAAAHHVTTEVEDAGDLRVALANADLDKIKIRIEKRLKMYGKAHAWLIKEEDPMDLESGVFNVAAIVEAHLALGDDSDLGFDECGCIKDLDTKIKWEDWRFPWLRMPIKKAMKMELEG